MVFANNAPWGVGGGAYESGTVVTNDYDSGPGSLRQAIAEAAPDETIEFALTYPATITLTSGELVITKDLTIVGPGAELRTVSGNHASRVFNITSGVTVTLEGLTLRDGYVANGKGDGGGHPAPPPPALEPQPASPSLKLQQLLKK